MRLAPVTEGEQLPGWALPPDNSMAQRCLTSLYPCLTSTTVAANQARQPAKDNPGVFRDWQELCRLMKDYNINFRADSRRGTYIREGRQQCSEAPCWAPIVGGSYCLGAPVDALPEPDSADASNGVAAVASAETDPEADSVGSSDGGLKELSRLAASSRTASLGSRLA